LDDIGSLLHEAWGLKKRLSSKISNPVIENIYARAREAGAIGGKLLGAGGGGFLLIFAEPDLHGAIKSALGEFQTIQFKPEFSGSSVIYYQSGL